MELPQQETCSGLPVSSPGNLPDPGIEPASPALAGGFFTPEPPGKHILSIVAAREIWGSEIIKLLKKKFDFEMCTNRSLS